MQVEGKNFRTVWMEMNSVFMIDQNQLPFKFRIHECRNHSATCEAIKNMIVRGAGAIGTAAGFALAQAFLEAPEKNQLEFVTVAKQTIESTRPTARNLFYATDLVYTCALEASNPTEKAVEIAQEIADKDVEDSLKIGEFGNQLIPDNAGILTHCNAGWLAFTDFGTALSPIYLAQQQKKGIFVYVDETRPRCQGARLTAWEFRSGDHRCRPNSCQW